MEINNEDVLLVTGATGLVGSHVAEEAIRRGIKTRVLVRETSDVAFLDSLGVEKIHGDMLREDSLKKAVEGVSIIVHCAAKVGEVTDSERMRIPSPRRASWATSSLPKT